MRAESVYLGDGDGTVLAQFAPPWTERASGLGVVLCPPFGWDESCSYRSRREWARHLAEAGHAVLRLDLPGTGDSAGGPADPELVEEWIASVGRAAAWLRRSAEARRVVAIGIGLGGMLAYAAAARQAPIDDLVLWAVPARGRTLLRELRAFARLEASEFGDRPEPADELPEGAMAAGGFLLAPGTVGALEALDLTKLSLSGPHERRVLLLKRGMSGVDGRLEAHLEAQGVPLTVAPGRGYSGMMAPPHQARPPRQTFAAVDAWLAEGEVAGSPFAPGPGPAERRSLELEVEGRPIRESAFTVPGEHGRLPGVLAEPALHEGAAPLGVLMLNAGLIRRSGPGRMWAETARRWAGRGVPSLRLDLEGIGDADGDERHYEKVAGFHRPRLTEQVLAAVARLTEAGVAEEWVLVGLCSGASWSFEAAQRDPRVVAAVMLNPRSLIFDEGVESERDARKAVGSLYRGWAWRRLLGGDVPLTRVIELGQQAVRALLNLPARLAARRHARRLTAETVGALDRLRDGDKWITLVFVDGEPLHDELERTGVLARLDSWPNVTLEHIPGGSHTFRPIAAQRAVHAVLDAAIAAELEGARGSADPVERPPEPVLEPGAGVPAQLVPRERRVQA